MHYAKVVGIFQALHPGRTTISVLQGLGYFSPSLSFKCVISLRCNGGYHLHSRGKDELGLAGVVKGSPPLGTHGLSWPLASPKASEVGTHRTEEQRSDAACTTGHG